jgi:exodeoxyribonuclease VII small subunit
MATSTPERFEEILERLQGIVEKLEAGNLTLEESLRQFEEGVRLSRLGAAMLDDAERRVEALLRNAEGTDKVEPFPESGGDEVPF